MIALLYWTDVTFLGAVVRINASLVRTGPWSQPAMAAELRAQALASIRERTDDDTARRYIYDGLLSREQAARGAVIGQYVRIAQAEGVPEVSVQAATAAGDATIYLRRDLIDSMLQQMTGEASGWSPGATVVATV